MALTKINSRSATSLDATVLSGVAPTGSRQLGTATTTLVGSLPKTLSVPSGCQNFTIALHDWSWAGSGNPDFGFRLGTGGSLSTSGYMGQISYIYNQGSDSNDIETTKMGRIGNWGQGTKHSGIAHFYETTANTWVMTCQYTVDNSGGYSNGGVIWSPSRIVLGGECDIVGFVDYTSTSGVTGDSGHMTAYFH